MMVAFFTYSSGRKPLGTNCFQEHDKAEELMLMDIKEQGRAGARKADYPIITELIKEACQLPNLIYTTSRSSPRDCIGDVLQVVKGKQNVDIWQNNTPGALRAILKHCKANPNRLLICSHLGHSPFHICFLSDEAGMHESLQGMWRKLFITNMLEDLQE